MDRSFDALVAEAASAPIEGWDFSWLDGRAVEDRPSWRYFDLVAARAPAVDALLDVETGAGSMLAALPSVPRCTCATEAWPPNVAIASARLRGRAHVVHADGRLPFADRSFALVTSRHPIAPAWGEIARVLRPGGTYLAQHVGPDSLRDLSERFVGPWPSTTSERALEVERAAAEAAGLTIVQHRLERPRTAFHDIGAVVFFLRLVVWIVPGFDVERFRPQLLALHEQIEGDGGYETTASRVLVEASAGSTGVARSV